MSELYGFDAFSPTEIAAKVNSIERGWRACRPAHVHAGRAGGRIHRARCAYFTVVRSDASHGLRGSPGACGVVFSLGLLLVIVAGAELFTGNNLLVMAWADGLISTREVLCNWAIVSVGNLLGSRTRAAGLSVTASGNEQRCDRRASGDHCGNQADVLTAFSAVRCATCWSAWRCGMALAGRSVIDKAVAIVFRSLLSCRWL